MAPEVLEEMALQLNVLQKDERKILHRGYDLERSEFIAMF